MKLIKVSETSGPALDWLVAKAQGFDVYHSAMLNGHTMYGFWISGYYPGDLNSWLPLHAYRPSTDWAQGGPIIEREKIATDYDHDVWNAAKYELSWYIDGPTPLIAAMRCFVVSKLGEIVEVPDELI